MEVMIRQAMICLNWSTTGTVEGARTTLTRARRWLKPGLARIANGEAGASEKEVIRGQFLDFLFRKKACLDFVSESAEIVGSSHG